MLRRAVGNLFEFRISFGNILIVLSMLASTGYGLVSVTRSIDVLSERISIVEQTMNVLMGENFPNRTNQHFNRGMN